MYVTLRQLKVFEAMARQLNYTQAAQKLHLSQSAITIKINQLEENPSKSLFAQIGKKAYLTKAGSEMYHYSSIIAQQPEEADEVLQQLKGVQSRKLIISVASTC
jgi:DNA-binding transcriptional LysR family regulator